MKKRSVKKIIFMILVLIIALGTVNVSASAAVKMNKSKSTLIKGQTVQLKISGTKKKANWSSTNSKVAVVSKNGKVTAKNKGTANITAIVSGKKYICKVTVEAPYVSKKSVSLTKGQKYTLKMNGTKQKVSWYSSKKSVATVSSKGIITAKSAGSATISAKVGGKTYKCSITVKNPVISLSEKAKTIYTNQSFDLILKNTNSKVLWTTSNSGIATIKKVSTYRYRITGKKAGTAIVTAKVGSKKYTCKVVVKNKPVKTQYNMGETWTVDGQWKLRVDSVKKTNERNPYSDLNPAAVYIVTFTYENLGYRDDLGIMNGLYFCMDNNIVDSAGYMGYSYPGEITYYPQETPIGAKCRGQVCIGVSHPGDFYLYVDQYDGNGINRKARFRVDV